MTDAFDPKLAVAVISLLVAITALAIQWSRNRKAFSYEVTDTSLFTVASSEVEHRVSILFDGKAVKDVHLVQVRFANTGRITIKESECKPLSLDFGADSEILSAEVKENVRRLPLSLKQDGEHLVIDPIMMNRGDSFTVQALVRSVTGKVTVLGRIEGIPSFRESIKRSKTGKPSVLNNIVIIGFLLCTGLGGFLSGQLWQMWQMSPDDHPSELNRIADGTSTEVVMTPPVVNSFEWKTDHHCEHKIIFVSPSGSGQFAEFTAVCGAHFSTLSLDFDGPDFRGERMLRLPAQVKEGDEYHLSYSTFNTTVKIIHAVTGTDPEGLYPKVLKQVAFTVAATEKTPEGAKIDAV
jgi:hypothetical protein